MRKYLVKYDFATAPFWISLYMRKILFSFFSVQIYCLLYFITDTKPRRLIRSILCLRQSRTISVHMLLLRPRFFDEQYITMQYTTFSKPIYIACTLWQPQSTYIGRDETGLVYLPTQLERTLQLHWWW
jgi:hypothetical protein